MTGRPNIKPAVIRADPFRDHSIIRAKDHNLSSIIAQSQRITRVVYHKVAKKIATRNNSSQLANSKHKKHKMFIISRHQP